MNDRANRAMGRDEFIRELQRAFPEVVNAFSVHESGILHCEVGAFRRFTEEAMDAGNAWLAERHFRFVEACLQDAAPELLNALEVSYLEDLALGKHTHNRHRIVKERMPFDLRRKLIDLHAWWN